MSDARHADCPAREVLDHLTGRWAVLVLGVLRSRAHRYHELRAEVDGISDKMLSHTLRVLTGDGLLDRVVTAASPPEVTYSLTDLGRGASAALQPMLDWIRDHAEEITSAGRKKPDGVTRGARPTIGR
ncbi:winged helix-turn-helix transcriptional regulator [Pseudonocardia endophytica]|uniref:HxlR family transcriptional regulator n=1 Tax=Pseudonocardia endophytica TaxID=401976 RepID=A0A4R1HQX0_PSEEN|nr:helix-turn-helix domain-containing protein [Pseudonocardia endophytica]TCK22159.1 HxlR family transcriptional regulator [Pseudonocardia endophytica]